LQGEGGASLVVRTWTKKNVLWSTVITIFGIVCFPANPLVLTGVLETSDSPSLFIVGWVVWAFGMVLVMAPIVMFPRRGGVAKGRSFVNTTRMVDTGIYSVVRHPQYLGGVFAVFVTTILWYPHWLFGVLGAIATAVIYMSCREEDQRLVQQFGDDYMNYMWKVPRMNVLAGVIRLLRRRRRA
jgi:protein-S-isoprenylcysteine O-methyltransferase Ste14